jgi:hypothetical protein
MKYVVWFIRGVFRCEGKVLLCDSSWIYSCCCFIRTPTLDFCHHLLLTELSQKAPRGRMSLLERKHWDYATCQSLMEWMIPLIFNFFFSKFCWVMISYSCRWCGWIVFTSVFNICIKTIFFNIILILTWVLFITHACSMDVTT